MPSCWSQLGIGFVFFLARKGKLMCFDSSTSEPGCEGPNAAAASSRSRRQAAPAVGLSNAHISPGVSSFSAAVAFGGSVLRLKRSGGPAVGGGLRGKCGPYNAASRRRCLEVLASLNKLAFEWLPLFVTLTYPGRDWSPDPLRWKRDLDVFLKRLRKLYPKAAVIWKLEPQTRGAPHYHLLVFNVKYLDKAWLSRSWYEVVGSGQVDHLHAGTQVKRARSWNGVMGYSAKYLGKVPEAAAEWPEYVGRWWGIVGRDHLPVLWYVETMRPASWFALRRVGYHYLRKHKVKTRSRPGSGVMVFMPAVEGFRLMAFYGMGAESG